MRAITLTKHGRKNYMVDSFDSVTIKLQITLNKRMYGAGRISYDTYSKVNDILQAKLT